MPRGTFEFKYGMKHRGFSPGCQPKKGLYRRIDDDTNEFFDIVSYTRRLSDREIEQYELVDLNKVPASKLTKLREMAGLKQTELARAAKVPLRTVQRYELEGMDGAALSQAVRIADVLKLIDLREFLNEPEKDSDSDQD